MLSFSLTARAVLCASLLGFGLLFSACDSDGSGDEEGFLLEPIRNSLVRFQFPEEADRVETLSFTQTLTFTTDHSAFEGGDEVTLEAAETLSIPDFLVQRGHAPGALRRALVNAATITIESPAEETLNFIGGVLLEFGSEDSGMQPVVNGGAFCCGSTASLSLYQADFYELAQSPSLIANLRIQAYDLPDTPGDYTFTIHFGVELTVGTSPPAPDAILLDGAISIREGIRYQGFDVGDVLEARIVGVYVDEAQHSELYYHTPMAELSRRLHAMTITVRSVEEPNDVRELTRFDPFAPNGSSVSRTNLDLDITDLVRRAGRFELAASLTLEPSAGYRGEAYAFWVHPILEVEVRTPSSEGDTSP